MPQGQEAEEGPLRQEETAEGAFPAALTTSSAGVLGGQQLADGLFERREISLDDVENTLDVDPEVLVRDEVTEAGDV
jgi:hypothetical protein